MIPLCGNCNRPLAESRWSMEDGAYLHPDGSESPEGCECVECVALCWTDGAECEPYDWRAALAAKSAQVQELLEAK